LTGAFATALTGTTALAGYFLTGTSSDDSSSEDSCFLTGAFFETTGCFVTG